MNEYISLVENALKEYMETEENKEIYKAMSYSLFAGGKRLRPQIMMMTAKMLNKDPQIVLPFACAMEMIHTYSLIHDDLPAMDNDDLRRGKPTNHKVFGEAMAILAGDALLTKAFEIASSYNVEGVCKQSVISAIGVLASAAGADGMIGGQVIDINGCVAEMDKLFHLHSLKTGAIIRASGVIGAILSGASDDEIAAVDGFCKNLGIAFQIQDDILDVEGSVNQLGKPIGSDAENDKVTYVTLCGIDAAKKLAKKYTNDAVKCLDIFENKDELSDLALSLTERKA